MSTKFWYTVYPKIIDTSQTFKAEHDSMWNSNFIGGTAFAGFLGLIMLLFGGPSWLFIVSLIIILIYFVINHLMNEARDKEYTENLINLQKERAQHEATVYSQKFNDIISKSEQIVFEMLPYFESSALQSIEKAKTEFSANAYSPFWSEIEEASKFFACYKDAIDQLCFNSEIYTCTLRNLKHNFPMPFPIGTKISLSQNLLDEYKTTIRKAQTDPTFSIIWEQRRNSALLIGGFRTLENAIYSMSDRLHSSLSDLQNSFTSELEKMRYVQKEQLLSFELSQAYLQNTLNSMDNKLYYIQWKEKPLGKFYPK